MRIGVTLNSLAYSDTDHVQSINTNYVSFLSKFFAPASIVLLPFGNQCAELDLLNGLDMLVLSGGNDVLCCGKTHSASRNFFETKLVEECLANKIPILGICRGMQLIGKHFGAKIIQLKNKKHVDTIHFLSMNNELSEICGEVNSFHDYGVSNNFPFHFNKIIYNEIVEAFWSDDFGIVGIQWHPERLLELDEISRFLLSNFKANANRRSQ